MTHEAGWAHAPGALRAPSWLREPTDPNALVSPLWSSTAHKQDGVLTVGGVPLTELAAEHGSPAYVLDEADFRSRARAFKTAFGDYDVFYAGKAFLCTTVAQWVAEEGLCLDVCSGGELTVAERVGFDMARVGFHGNNKSLEEIERAVTLGVGRIILDSFHEIQRVAEVAERLGRTQRVMVRVTAGVEAHTHEYIAPPTRTRSSASRSPTARRTTPSAAWSRRPASSCSACTPTSAARSSTPPASRWPLGGCWPCTRGSPTSSR